MNRRHTRRGVIALVASSLLLVVGGLVVPGTTSGFSSKVVNTTNTAASNSYFKCTDYFTANAATATSYFEYPMADATSSTSATDSSSNAATGTYGGTRTLDAASPLACPKDTGSSSVFDGSSTYLTTPTKITNPTTFTIAIWFKTSTAAGKLIGFGSAQTGSSGQYDRHLYITSGGGVDFGTYNSGVQVVAAAGPYTDGKWHQAVGTFSASTGMCLYMDGAQISCNTAYTTAENTSGYWRIGYDSVSGWTNQPSSFYFKGSLRYAAAYKTVLSSSEIASEYAAGKPA